MKKTLLFSALLVLTVAACDRPASTPSANTPEPATSSAATANPAAPAKKRSRKLTAEQLAQITASGKTGLWSDTPEVCSNRKLRKPLILAWNVQATGAKGVVVYLAERNGERRVTRGTAVGGQVLGRWVRPGSTFLLRDADKKTELGKLVIGTKPC
jgi:hypothetical protein